MKSVESPNLYLNNFLDFLSHRSLKIAIALLLCCDYSVSHGKLRGVVGSHILVT